MRGAPPLRTDYSGWLLAARGCYHSVITVISQERSIVTTLRLSPNKHRQLRLAVARRGTSIQKALEIAIDLWLATPEKNSVDEASGMALEGLLAGVDALGALKRERRKKLAKDERKLRR